MNAYRRMSWRLFMLSFVTLGAAFFAIWVVLERYQQHDVDGVLLEMARSEALEAPANRFSFASRPGPVANDIGPLQNHGVMFDEQGRVVSATSPFDPPNADLFAEGLPSPKSLATYSGFDFSFGNRRYRGVLVPIPQHPGRTLLLATSREDLDDDSRFLAQALVTAFIVVMLWLAGSIQWLVRMSLRDHERIADRLHRIASGEMQGRVVVADRDLQRLGGDVDEIAERLAGLIDHQRRFIAHAAHELRSPLAALHGEIQRAQRKERSVAEYQLSMAFLAKASQRLKRLADELLELARVDGQRMVTGRVSLLRSVSEVVESMQPLLSAKSLVVERKGDEQFVRASVSGLDRIVRNLLDNAIRHSPLGGTLHVLVEPSGADRVRLCVTDEGEGVLAEERDQLFHPFFRSASQRSDSEGAGLGLTISRELARSMGGDLELGEVASQFVLTLLAAPPSAELAAPNTALPLVAS